MGLFDEVKENVTVRQAAEFYGFKITKSGLISCIFHNDKTKIANIKAYLITALYNAPNTISHYYSAEVNHDMCGVRLGNCTGNQ